MIARDCTTADSYATALSVLGPNAGLKLIQATSGAEAIITRVEVGKPVTVESRGFKKFETNGP